jgi:hypothetical protein
MLKKKKQRWKVKVLVSKKFIGVRAENLNHLLDYDPIPQKNITSLTDMPNIGDQVKTKRR